MKLIPSVFAVIAVLGFPPRVRAAEPSTANPSDAIRSFYRWYVTELIGNREPIENRKEMERFVSERPLNLIDRKKKGPDGLEGDYFLDAQDFDNLWAKNITVSNVKVRGKSAMAEVLLTGNGEMRRRLQVSLTNDGVAWKIIRVQGVPYRVSK
ncbi:MAG TPA: DUF3828 domain-containing protein [Chthoniobacterales bacterium]|nr:DUF3828 domain-containing protein [Chthoniobacterales bacterium]